MALSPDCVMRVSCCQRFMMPVAKLFFLFFLCQVAQIGTVRKNMEGKKCMKWDVATAG